ncbi:MAG: HepT-like ribonuclease domain-containing protein [Cyanobacteria bacterium P01_F01_bin.13]
MEIQLSKYLYDIQQAGLLIQEFTEGQDFAAYSAQPVVKAAVERQFITIGEALNQVLRLAPDLENKITDARKIVDFRNLLTHSYSTVSDEVVWDILQSKLLQLMEEVDQLLAE